MTTQGAGSVASLNPFERVEAETIAWNSGVETETCSEGGMNVTSIDSGDYIKLKEVEFGAGATSFEARVAATATSGTIELRLDSEDGTVIGTCAITTTGDDTTWATQTCELTGAQGKHDLFLVFTGGGFKFNWWQVSGPGASGGDTSSGPDTGSTSGASTESTSATTESDSTQTTTQAESSTSNATSTASSSGGTEPRCLLFRRSGAPAPHHRRRALPMGVAPGPQPVRALRRPRQPPRREHPRQSRLPALSLARAAPQLARAGLAAPDGTLVSYCVRSGRSRGS